MPAAFTKGEQMKYRVIIPYACYVAVVVEADSKEEAIETVYDDSYISELVGNGGTDKLIGVDGDNVSITAGETPLEMKPFKIEVEEVGDDE